MIGALGSDVRSPDSATSNNPDMPVVDGGKIVHRGSGKRSSDNEYRGR